MVTLILIFILLYGISMLVHEFGHMIGITIQGSKARMEMWNWKGLPSLHVTPLTSIKNDKLVDYMGGGFAGIIYLLLFTLLLLDGASSAFLFSYLTLGIMHLIYGIYEGLLLRRLSVKRYMIGHYLLYGVVIVLCYVLLLPLLK